MPKLYLDVLVGHAMALAFTLAMGVALGHAADEDMILWVGFSATVFAAIYAGQRTGKRAGSRPTRTTCVVAAALIVGLETLSGLALILAEPLLPMPVFAIWLSEVVDTPDNVGTWTVFAVTQALSFGVALSMFLRWARIEADKHASDVASRFD